MTCLSNVNITLQRKVKEQYLGILKMQAILSSALIRGDILAKYYAENLAKMLTEFDKYRDMQVVGLFDNLSYSDFMDKLNDFRLKVPDSVFASFLITLEGKSLSVQEESICMQYRVTHLVARFRMRELQSVGDKALKLTPYLTADELNNNYSNTSF